MGLTPANFQTLTRLTKEALTHSSLTLQAKLDLTTAQQDEALAGRVLDNLSLQAGVGVASNSGYEQLKPDFSVSASFDVIGFANTSPSQLPELQAKLAEAKHQVHQQVLTTYLAYRQVLDQAHLAADALDIAKATLKVQGVRLKAGDITETDYLASRQKVEQAQVNLAAANYQIVLSKSALAQSVGISVKSLNHLLKDSKDSP
jgi:outer membrane protein TolC